LAVLAVLTCAVGRLAAGEAIVFGSAKTKAEPGKDPTLGTQGPFRFEKLNSPSPFGFEGLPPLALPQLGPIKKDKRQQNADDEKRNWLLLDPGELQDKQEEKSFLGLKDDDIEGLGKGKNSRDYTFHDKDSSRVPGQLRGPTQPHSPNQQHKPDPNQPAARNDEADDLSDTKRPSRTAIIFGKDSPTTGSGQAFDLKGLLGTRGIEKSDSLGSLFGGADFTRSREQDARTETFRQLLSGPGASGQSDPLNFRSDLTREPINPTLPSFAEPPRQAAGSEAFMLRPTAAQPGTPFNYLVSPDTAARGQALGPAASSGPWRPTPVEWPRSRF
jgi:hypothetical protein